ncbi:MAG: FecR domain-containing protein [Bdellovibrio sp.]
MSRFDKTEKLILLTALLALVVFSYFLYDDSLLFSKVTNARLELIGDVAQSKNDVRRKNSDTFSWIPALRQDKVFQNDSIFTGENSHATIQLQDGTQIQIEPNSLITLNSQNGQMNLDLRYGNLVGELAQGSSLTVKSGVQEFKLESRQNTQQKSKIQLKKAPSGQVGMKLISGNLQYKNPRKQTVAELPQNATVAVTQKGDVRPVEKPQLFLRTADKVRWLREKPQDPLPFAWQSRGDISRYEFEMSSTADFNTVLIAKSTSEMQTQVTEKLPSGVYYWRLKAVSSEGEIQVQSPTQQIFLTQLGVPEIITPTPAAAINLTVKGTPENLSAATPWQWKAEPALRDFRWQLSQTEDFSAVLGEGRSKTLSVLSPKLPAGTYWLRVQGATAEQKVSAWSEPVSFSLNLTAYKEERPAPPILVTKDISFQPPGKERAPASPTAPQLVWKPVLQGKSYQVQIAKDIQFTESEKYEVAQTQMAWSRYRPGQYYYRVYTQGQNGLISEPSEVGTLNIHVQGVILNPVKAIHVIASRPEPKQATLSWNEVPFAKSYLIEFDKNKNFSQPQQLNAAAPSAQLTLAEPGSYHIRVQALDENSKPLTEFSNIEEALYSFRSPLVSPTLVEPFNNASIFLQTEAEPFIWLEWKKVPGATVYNLEISDKPDFSHILISKSIDGNRYLIKDRVPMGKIYWRVKAEAKGDSEISDWSEKREFTLYHQKNETFVK